MRNGGGLKINYYKSVLIFLGEISTNSFLLSLIFNYPIQRLSITYLGLSLTLRSLNKPKWIPLIENVQKRLAGSKGRLLSLGGRVTMINAVLSTIPTYFLSFFLFPIWVKRKIDSLRRKFLWNGVHREAKGFCLINWKRVCKRKEFEDLRVINI